MNAEKENISPNTILQIPPAARSYIQHKAIFFFQEKQPVIIKDNKNKQKIRPKTNQQNNKGFFEFLPNYPIVHG